jgi:adenine/guanine phosphoribosyltransferase-like PRPP-binding protein
MRRIDYDTLIGTGLSGALAVPALARAVGCSWAVVRKDGDCSHSGNAVEGTVGRRWVFVDDLISSGDTRARVRAAMQLFSEMNDFETEYVGDYLYYGNQFRPKEEGNT